RELVTLRGGAHWVISLAFTPDRKTLAAAIGDGSLRLWDLSGKEPKERTTLQGQHKGGLLAVAISPDGKTLASSSRDKTVRLWDLGAEQPREKATLTDHGGLVSWLAFTPDGKTLITGGTTVRLWDLRGEQSREKAALKEHTLDATPDDMVAMTLSPDGHSL